MKVINMDKSTAEETRRKSFNAPVAETSKKHNIYVPKALLITALGLLFYFCALTSNSSQKYFYSKDRLSLDGSYRTERKLMENNDQQIRACQPPTTREIADLPNLIPIQKWTSNKQRPRESVSAITQLSIDRLPALENQCITWPDHLVAVVYIPMVGNSSGGPPLLPTYVSTTLDDIIRGMESFHHFMESTAACAFHLELVGQFIHTGMFPGPYPINALRNRGLSLSPTDLAIQIDADFVLTPMLGLPGKGYRDLQLYNQMVELAAERTALVVPALELSNKWQDLSLARNVARSIVLGGKAVARRALQTGTLMTYQTPESPVAHRAANLSKWGEISTPLLYEVPYTPGFEPVVLLSLSAAPWYDERFVDYGGGAVTWFTHLASSNFTFMVHPFAFVVHVPHTRTMPSSRYMEAQRRQREARMLDLRRQVELEVMTGIYSPVVRGCGSDGEKVGMKDVEYSNDMNEGAVNVQQEEEEVNGVDVHQESIRDVNNDVVAVESRGDGENSDASVEENIDE